MTRVRTLFAEALRSIGANVSTTVASALSVLIGMFLVGVFIGLGTWLVSWSDDKKRELAVHVFVADAATTKQVNELRVVLESDKRVKPGGITFISKAEALAIMRKRNPELTENLASNPLPASFDVVPSGVRTPRRSRSSCRSRSCPPSTRCAMARRSRSASSP
jgi:cell division protein FtsX